MDFDTHLLLVGTVVGILYLVSMHLAVLQFDTFLYLVDILLCHWLVEEHVVNLLLQELRMCEF